jgi:hypothetical protein
MRERFLHIDVPADADGGQRDDRVGVVGRGHDHGVDVLLLVEHLALIAIDFGPGKLLERLGGVTLVHVTERHDVLGGALLEVVVPYAANADAGDVELLARRLLARGAERGAGNQGEG